MKSAPPTAFRGLRRTLLRTGTLVLLSGALSAAGLSDLGLRPGSARPGFTIGEGHNRIDTSARERVDFAPPGPPGPPHRGREEAPGDDAKGEELRLLGQFLALPPDRLSRVRQTIERIERMSPEERERLRSELEAYRRLNPETRAAIRKRWDGVSHQDRALMRRYFFDLNPEERIRERERLAAMNPSERSAYLRELVDDMRARLRDEAEAAIADGRIATIREGAIGSVREDVIDLPEDERALDADARDSAAEAVSSAREEAPDG